jgi:hypothetical protein
MCRDLLVSDKIDMNMTKSHMKGIEVEVTNPIVMVLDEGMYGSIVCTYAVCK